MLLQEKIEREAKATVRQTLRAVMTGYAATGEELRAGFAFIEIFRTCRSANHNSKDSGDAQPASKRHRSHHVRNIRPAQPLPVCRGQACQKEGAFHNSGGSNQFVSDSPPSTVIAAPVT